MGCDVTTESTFVQAYLCVRSTSTSYMSRGSIRAEETRRDSHSLPHIFTLPRSLWRSSNKPFIMPFFNFSSIHSNARAEYHAAFDADSSTFLGQELPVAKRMLKEMGLNADSTTVGFAKRIDTAEECGKEELRDKYEQGGGTAAVSAQSATAPVVAGQGAGAAEPNFDGGEIWDCIIFDGNRGFTIGEHSMSHFEVKVEQSSQADSPPEITLAKMSKVRIVQRGDPGQWTESWTLSRQDDATRWSDMITAWVSQRVQGQLEGSRNVLGLPSRTWSHLRADQRFFQAHRQMSRTPDRFCLVTTATREGSQRAEAEAEISQTTGQNPTNQGGCPASDASVVSESTKPTHTTK